MIDIVLQMEADRGKRNDLQEEEWFPDVNTHIARDSYHLLYGSTTLVLGGFYMLLQWMQVQSPCVISPALDTV